MLDLVTKFSRAMGYDPILNFDEKQFITDDDIISGMNVIYKVLNTFGISWEDFVFYYPDLNDYLLYDPLTAKDYFDVFRFFRDGIQFSDVRRRSLRKMVFDYRRDIDWWW